MRALSGDVVEISSNSEFARLAVKAEEIKKVFEGGNTSERKEINVRKTCHITNAIHAQIDKEEGIRRIIR